MFLDWLEHHLLPCPTKYFFGVECPGCGMQRAIIELLRGNLVESIKLYPPLIPIMLMLVVLIINLKVNSAVWQKVLKYFFIAEEIIIFINYILNFI